ncbi:DUF6624 domain-containing protein [Maribacter spongiicola]|uniref:DUF6624 domain-containing protein n=1 Tax=Maribacter spongiicola TaxID=1206753 RepID=UPI003F991AA6
MNKIYKIVFIGILLIGCKEITKEQETDKSKVEFNQVLADELLRMAVVDQIAAGVPSGKYRELPLEEWKKFKDSVFRTREKRLQKVFKNNGFLGYDLVGKDGSRNFFLMVQHSDHKPEFQSRVLEKMKIEVDKSNANSGSYGLLVDRVNLNTGKAQIYGTQVTYNMNTGQAYPKKLKDSINVNKRRKSIGLEPIEVYLNDMSEKHFEMQKENCLNKGITKPFSYKTE